MKVNFGKYTYSDNRVDPDYKELGKNAFVSFGVSSYSNTHYYNNNFAFDSTHFNDLVKNREYEAAINYASQYRFNDVETQKQFEYQLHQLRREGEKMTAIYNRAPQEAKDAVNFSLNIFADGGLENMSDDNIYKQQYIELKNKLGGEDSDSFKIKFKSKKRVGLFGDWSVSDSDYGFEEWLDEHNYSVEQLRNAGINPIKKDGDTYIIVNKSNKLANSILYSLHNSSAKDFMNIVGFNSKNKEETQDIKYGFGFFDYFGNNNPKRHGTVFSITLSKMNKLITDAQHDSRAYVNPNNIEKELKSTTVGTFIPDGLQDLREARDKGLISKEEFKQRFEEQYGDIVAALRSIGNGNIKMWSNSFNDDPNDQTLVELDNIQRTQAINDISQSDDFVLQSMIMNGVIGTLVTIGFTGVDAKNLKENTNSKDAVRNKRRQIFIPGLFHDKAQQSLDANTETRAYLEVDNMMDWGYNYKTSDGKNLNYVSDGVFNYNGTFVDREQAKSILNRSMIIEDASMALKYQYMNTYGKIDKNAYNDHAKIVAIQAVNELMPNIQLNTIDGTPLDLTTWFDIKGIGADVQDKYKHLFSFDTYKKIVESYKIYDEIVDKIANN